MTTNKFQGQTLDYVGIYLHKLIFSYGHLYVALSRAKISQSIKNSNQMYQSDNNYYNYTKKM